MEPANLGGLAVLALVDSTSLGTLLIPLWMMLAPRLRPSTLLIYLAIVGVFYFGVGLLLLAGFDAIATHLADPASSRAARIGQLIIGIALVGVSYLLDPAYDRLARKKPPGERGPSPRALRWQQKLTAADVSVPTVATIALTATTLEVATMLPYLGAIAIVGSSGISGAAQVAVLACYVLLMLLPALIIFGLRLALGSQIEPMLEKLGNWMTNKAGSAVAWAVGIVGVLLALNAMSQLR